MSERLTIFFAWQSDLPNKTNRSAISQALRTAATAVEEQFADRALRIALDEAVRDEPGSPNIPETIRAKIQASLELDPDSRSEEAWASYERYKERFDHKMRAL